MQQQNVTNKGDPILYAQRAYALGYQNKPLNYQILYYTGLNSNVIKSEIKQINYAIAVLSFKWYNSEENWWWFGGFFSCKNKTT